LLDKLRALGEERNRKGMARFGINVERAFGVSTKTLREIAKRHAPDADRARELWASGYHEARILSVLLDEPDALTPEEAERRAAEFDSWDVCDQACMALLRKTPFAFEKSREWRAREETFVKRAGFALGATLAVHHKGGDDVFLDILEDAEREAADERNFVKKAISWAVRQIGKRSLALREEALATADRLAERDAAAARWIGRDAARELRDPATVARIREKERKGKRKTG
jgi:3-methyladenine DNA glycosylase AlkD